MPEALSSEFANLYFTDSAIPMDTKCQNVPSASEIITNGDGVKKIRHSEPENVCTITYIQSDTTLIFL